MQANIAIVTNARAADQRSMLGYGALLLEAARGVDFNTVEMSATSVLSDLVPASLVGNHVGKLVRDVERFLLTPSSFIGRSARICHVVDPGNAPYLDVIRHHASIVTVHDLIPYLCLSGRLAGFRPSLTGRWLMRRILERLKRTDRIVCVSECTRRDLLELTDLDPSRILTIPNAIFQPMAPASSDECTALRSELGLPAGAPIVLHVGRNFYKNRKVVLEVFSRVRAGRKDVHMALVGSLTRDLIDLSERLGITQHVHVLPHVASDKMAALYTTSSLLLFPSLYEGFGYPVLEAQLCGTPVVCSDGGSLGEVAGDGARILAPGDVDGMTHETLQLLEDTSSKAELCARGRENAARFSRRNWFSAHSALYTELGASHMHSHDTRIL